jgi:hypothetical protein
LKKLVLLLIPLILTSCGKRTEVRDRTFISTVAIYQKSDVFYATVTDNSGRYEGNGDCVFSALSKVKENSGKNMFFGHTELLSVNIGELDSNLIALLKTNYLSPNTLLCTTDNSSYINENVVSKIQNNAANGYITSKTIAQTLQDLISTGESSVPFITETTIEMRSVHAGRA